MIAQATNAPIRDASVVRSRSRPLRVLVLSSVFPSTAHPSYGVFVKERVRAVAAQPGIDVRVLAPTPYVPPIDALRRRYVWSGFPTRENLDGLQVVRPRYPLLPKIGGYLQSTAMFPPVLRAATRLRRDFEFDLIDAHFAYPTGVVAERLGRRFGVPVVVTGRGEDMLRFPSLPVIGRRIRAALGRNVWCVALSDEIADAFVRNGATPDRVVRIPNGIDGDRFRPHDRAEARRRLGLPPGAPVALSVGNLQERKGFHLLVDAFPAIRRRFPEALLVIVGGPAPYGADCARLLGERIRANGLTDHVRLPGRQRHEDLPFWYSAADVFALMSSREGSPNVLLEALACGAPAVATGVGGIREELADPALGIVVPERSVEATEKGLIEALNRDWDRRHIQETLRWRTWDAVARQVMKVFSDAVPA